MADEGSSRMKGSSRCVKCGTCQAVCPVFAVMPDESSSARGKMALAEAVGQQYVRESDACRRYLERCLLCGACEEACPSEVPTLRTMLEAREHLAERLGIKPGKKVLLKQLVGGPRLLDLAMRTGRSLQGIVFRRIPAESGIRRRFPLPLISRERTLPELSPVFLTDRLSGLVREGPGPRVGVFAGCMTNYFYPDTGERMIDLIAGTGASVTVPARQVCCGMPALTGGAVETVAELALQNLLAFEEEELDHIVTGCASCGGNLKENYARVLGDAGIQEDRIERFVSRVLDINEFLCLYGQGDAAEKAEQGPEPADAPLLVTYHHPCHLGRLQGVRDEPLALIRSLGGVRYVPMAEDDRCCGMGGSFSLEHYDLAREINDRKVARIVETGAGAVVTSCPACIMHIRDGLARNGRSDIEVLNITDLLVRCGRRARPGEEPSRDAGEGEIKKAG